MPAPMHDLAHLGSLLEAAKSQADLIGPPTAGVSHHLAQAIAELRNTAAHGGTADEGLRPDELTTDNDR